MRWILLMGYIFDISMCVLTTRDVIIKHYNVASGGWLTQNEKVTQLFIWKMWSYWFKGFFFIYFSWMHKKNSRIKCLFVKLELLFPYVTLLTSCCQSQLQFLQKKCDYQNIRAKTYNKKNQSLMICNGLWIFSNSCVFYYLGKAQG